MTEHTPGPWVGFSDQGKCIAIMPAGREGDVCTFKQPPNDADARLMTAAPKLADAVRQVHEFMMEDYKSGDSELWTPAYSELFDLVDEALELITDDVSGVKAP